MDDFYSASLYVGAIGENRAVDELAHICQCWLARIISSFNATGAPADGFVVQRNVPKLEGIQQNHSPRAIS